MEDQILAQRPRGDVVTLKFDEIGRLNWMNCWINQFIESTWYQFLSIWSFQGHKLLNQIPLCKQIIDPQVTFSAKHKHHHRFFSGNFFWLDFFCLFPWFPGKHQKWSTNQTPSNPEFESGLEKFRVEGKNPIFQSTLPVQYWVNCTSCHYFLGGNAAFGGYP